MMKSPLLYALLALLLAACAGTPDATPAGTEVPQNDDELVFVEPTLENPPQITVIPDLVEATIAVPTIRPTAEGELFQLAPGTLVVSQTEDVSPNKDFTYLRLERQHGPISIEGTPEPLIIEISGNGELKRNGEALPDVPLSNITMINTMLQEINLFGISGDYLGFVPVEGTGEYLYILLLEREDGTMQLTARDSLTPQPIRTLISLIIQQQQQP